MKNLFLIIAFTFSLSLRAGPGPNLKGFSCLSFNGDYNIQGRLKESCDDERYATWNPTGCFSIQVVAFGSFQYKKEFIRDFKNRETRQGFYTFYDWDEERWVLDGFIMKLEPNADGQQEFRLDTRGNSRDQMTVVTRGMCEVF